MGRKLLKSATALAAVCGLAWTAAVGAPAAPVIENGSLRVTFDPTNSHFQLTAKARHRDFTGTLRREGGEAAVVRVTDRILGAGQAIEVTYPDGGKDRLMLFPGLDFVLVRSSLQNRSQEPMLIHSLKTCACKLDLRVPAEEVKTLGTGGLLAPDKNPGSYVWLAAVEPQSRNGVVCGWVTEARGSGIVFSKVTGNAVSVEGQIDYGQLKIEPGQTAELETFAIGYFDDARLGLEAWADAVAKLGEIHLPRQPIGYCTWYSKPYGGAADEKHLAQLAAFSATNLAPFGFSVVQIDDGWQAGYKRSQPSSPKKNFTTHNPSGPYPGGMRAAAGRIQSLGLVPGIWFMPFAGTVGDPFFDSHPEWFAQTQEGKPFDTPWGGACLDLTHPGARAYVTDITRRICRDWGYQYIKIDGLWTGTATRQTYVNSGYQEDQMGEAVFHAGAKPNLEVYREGLKLVRQAAGTNVFILGCCASQNMRCYGGAFGLVDAMRVGPDNSTPWKALMRGPLFGSRQYFLNRRVWYSDPDPLYVRPEVPLHQAQLICSWVALSGQMNFCSEWLPGLPAERLDLLKRTMPYHNQTARPVDLFEQEPPRIWQVSERQPAPGREVVGLFNWTDKPQTIECPLARLGLDPEQAYVAFDYWGNCLLPACTGRLRVAVPGQSCVVLALRPKSNHPQLLSTSRHIAQGMVDVLEEQWDAAAKTLAGRSRVVGGDPYELRIVCGLQGAALELAAADKGAGAQGSVTTEAQLLRVQIKSPATREVSWKVRFK